MIPIRTACLITALAAWCSASWAAELRLGKVYGFNPGDTVSVTAALIPGTGDSVAALQFDVSFNATYFEFRSVAAGQSATDAGKSVLSSLPATGRVRCIVSGFNQNVMDEGAVAVLTFRVKSGTPQGAYVLPLLNVVLSDAAGGSVASTAVLGVILTGVLGPHSADINENWVIDFVELLRAIQLYTYGQYHCDATSADGYAGGAGSHDCAPHSSDYGTTQDWRISIKELLRLVQLYNKYAYHVDAAKEDGFAPGPFTSGAS